MGESGYYGFMMDPAIIKQLNEAYEHEEHNRRRPRATKHGTEAFYNFKRKKKRRR